MILAIGGIIVIAVILIYEEIEKRNATESAAQSEADAAVLAVEGQGQEITDIPPEGELPANTVTEAPNATINEFVGEAN